MQRLLIILAGFALIAAAPQDGMEEQDERDADEVVADAAKKITGAKNYSFKGTILVDAPSFGGGGGGGGEEQEPEPSEFEGEHGEEGSHIKTATQEIVKYKDKTASRPRSEWRVENEDEGGGRGGRRGFRGGMGRMFSRGFKMPHEDLKGIADKLKDVDNTEKTETIGEFDGTIYKADFTDEGAESFFPSNRMLERLEDVEFSATGKFWIDKDGNLLQYETSATLIGAFGANEFEITITKKTMVYKVGDTKVKLPKKAKKAIEEEDYR